MGMQKPDFIPSLHTEPRHDALGVLEGGIGEDEQYLALRLDRDLNGSHQGVFSKLEAAVEFATKNAKDGDRFQIVEIDLSSNSAYRVPFEDIKGFHFGVSGSVGFQYRDEERWFTRAYAEACAERRLTEVCPWSNQPIATVDEIARATARRRRAPNFGDSGSGSGRAEARR